MRRFLSRLGFALCIASGVLAAVLHVATFLTVVPLPWILPVCALLFGAVLCAQRFKSEMRFKATSRNGGMFSLALLLYAVLSFVYYYRATGGATSVDIVNGQYVYLHKSQIVRTITEHEYRIFPNRWTRVMSAWMGMMAVFGMGQFPSEE